MGQRLNLVITLERPLARRFEPEETRGMSSIDVIVDAVARRLGGQAVVSAGGGVVR